MIMSCESTQRPCKCGCGARVSRRRAFVNKEHQLRWMREDGASALNALQPLEAKARGGHTTGTAAVASGRLLEAAKLGGAKAREIAEATRPTASRDAT